MAWYNDWDDFKSSAGGKFLGSVVDPFGMWGLGQDRFSQAEQYGATDRDNFNLPGYDQIQDRYNQYLGDVRDRQAPEIGGFQNAQQSAVAGQQQGLADLLGARARGENSVAELQLRQAADQGMNQQAALAAGVRPGNSAMAARMAGQNMGRMQSALGGQAAIARAQEANMAAQGLGGLLGQMRGSDENLSMFNTGQQNQRTGMQAQMNQQQMAMNDAANNALLGQSLNAAQSQQQGGMGYENVQAGKYGAALGVPTAGEKMAGAATGILGGLLSDERAKTNIKPGGKAADQFLGTLSPHSYAYKPGMGSAGVPPGAPTLGVMAQSAQRTPMGAQAIGRGPNGMLFIDPQRMTGALAAGVGRLNERLGRVERKRG